MPSISTLLDSCLTWGALTLVVNLTFTMVGFTDQIKILHKLKDSAAVSLRKYLLLNVAIVVGLAHFAFERFDVYIAIPAAVQLGFALTVTGQIVYYRRYPGGYRAAAPRLAA